MDEQTRQLLIEAAILAPSADNSQPWCYRWNNEGLELWIDETRSGGFSDQRYMLSDLAIGTCIENIVIRAHSLGYDSRVEYLPAPEQIPLWAAKLHFSPAPTADDSLALTIPERHTDRSFPWRGPVTTTAKETLCSETARFQGVKLAWLDHTPHHKMALKAMWLAESLRFGNQGLHRELFSSIRFDLDYSTIGEEGLPPATLAIEKALRPFFRALRHWPVMRRVNHLGGNYIIGLRSAVIPALLSPALGIVSTQHSSRADIIQAGRALQRIWLKASDMGLAVQPFAAAGILALGHINIPATRQQNQIQKIKNLLQEITPEYQGLIFLRIGKSGRHRIERSGRRAADTFQWRPIKKMGRSQAPPA